MIFGDHVTPAESVDSAAWVGSWCRGRAGTVGAIVPNQFAATIRVYAPHPSPGAWWSEYRDLFSLVASIGARNTETPTRAWFAVWEGHGFENATSHIAWSEPALDDATRRAREQDQAQLCEEDRRRNAAIREALNAVPRFDLPHRAYYLMEGPLTAVDGLRYPGVDGWRNPDLIWPDDRRWFVATDVDFWSLYIGGDDDFITELRSNVPTRSEIVTLDSRLEIED